ncbi:MAG: F0F1 ATP synthase subunit B [Thiovulaceae bacterium]|jgi:F-type H+-transporting ATPase subunit b|nr:F0F1 ATP synthase subunit B [Sulfurimonadaceae bacterium]MDD3816473.1 F0F1 ATP synthase subunit B [Sulfurimonadaceae bacterium]
MSRILVFMLLISTYALASSGHGGEADTDIVQRTVNFAIFAALIWYLVAEPLKSYFASRSQGIADELQKVQDKLQETIALKKEALAKISEAEKFAENLAASSKKENKILNDNIMASCESELETLVKQNKTRMDFEQRAMVRNVVEEVLEEVLNESESGFGKDEIVNVILKKVA